MSPGLPVVRRPAATQDLREAVLWLRTEGSPRIADDFVDALEEALDLLSLHPLTGSGEVGIRLGTPGLRLFPISGTPYILYYIAHGRRDVDGELVGAG